MLDTISVKIDNIYNQKVFSAYLIFEDFLKINKWLLKGRELNSNFEDNFYKCYSPAKDCIVRLKKRKIDSNNGICADIVCLKIMHELSKNGNEYIKIDITNYPNGRASHELVIEKTENSQLVNFDLNARWECTSFFLKKLK